MRLSSVQTVAARTGEGTPYQQADEILVSFGEWFPDEAQMLRDLWSADAQDREIAKELVRENPGAIEHAAPYGLVVQGTTNPRIRAIERAVRGSSA